MEVIQFILDHSKKDSDLDKLKKTFDLKMEPIRSQVQNIFATQALNHLTPEKHTLGIIYLLYARYHVAPADRVLINVTEHLLQEMNPQQARKSPEKLAYVAHQYMKVCRENHLFYRAIQYLEIGIARFRPSEDHVTPLHADYLCMCLKAGNYKVGERLLEKKIFEIDPPMTAITTRDMLLYFYYGGMVYLGLKKLDKALYMFDTATQIPATGISAIMVESFKKLVLVSLLVHGKFHGISKHASHFVHRHINAHCTQYIDFSNAFALANAETLYAIANEHMQLFQRENNLGLIKQCISALKRRNIKKLTDTFMTLSLSDIARQAHLENEKEAEEELLRMIFNGEINASINKKDGMVAFEEDVQSFNSPAAGALLEEGITRSMQLAQRLKNTTDSISTSERYIARLHGMREELLDDWRGEGGGRQHAAAGGGGGGGSGKTKLTRVFDFMNRS